MRGQYKAAAQNIKSTWGRAKAKGDTKNWNETRPEPRTKLQCSAETLGCPRQGLLGPEKLR